MTRRAQGVRLTPAAFAKASEHNAHMAPETLDRIARVLVAGESRVAVAASAAIHVSTLQKTIATFLRRAGRTPPS